MRPASPQGRGKVRVQLPDGGSGHLALREESDAMKRHDPRSDAAVVKLEGYPEPALGIKGT